MVEARMGLLKEMRAALAKAVFEDDPAMIVLFTAGLSVAIGVFLTRDFSVFDNAVSYRFMRHLPENGWAGLFMLVGGSKAVVCLLNRPLMRRDGLRNLPVALNAAASIFWALIWAGIVTSNPDTLGTVLYAWLSLVPAYCAARRYRQKRDVQLGRAAGVF